MQNTSETHSARHLQRNGPTIQPTITQAQQQQQQQGGQPPAAQPMQQQPPPPLAPAAPVQTQPQGLPSQPATIGSAIGPQKPAPVQEAPQGLQYGYGTKAAAPAGPYVTNVGAGEPPPGQTNQQQQPAASGANVGASSTFLFLESLLSNLVHTAEQRAQNAISGLFHRGRRHARDSSQERAREEKNKQQPAVARAGIARPIHYPASSTVDVFPGLDGGALFPSAERSRGGNPLVEFYEDKTFQTSHHHALFRVPDDAIDWSPPPPIATD
uniref:Uncharacterized protein n=1 Tax=Vitrella brassicaformis TaxID=1169539 RepID=A0A7S1JVN3_9ALVE|mmetsp:Transcript_25752/g.63863  ORF Transcript_25752/g.63863 Transcript_25752/m.63863 type:complete len:269 (+) Transcript_25752:575-1381(+)